MFNFYIVLFLIPIQAFALTHPSCIQTKASTNVTSTIEEKIQTEQPIQTKKIIDFTNKEELKHITDEHRENMYTKLINEGVSKHIAKYVKTLELLEKPHTSYKKQPEHILTMEEYSSNFVKKIPYAKLFLEDNMEYLLEAEKKFSVDKETIVALITIESNLGQNKGQTNILNALFTMSHPSLSTRNSFFTNELVSAFKLISSNKHFFRANTMGSWAGAMGYTQFIPSSVIKYGFDGNDDGTIDIINNKVDAIYSAANYLNQVQWKKNEKILEKVTEEEISKIDPCKDNGQPYQNGTLFLAELGNKQNNISDKYFILYNNYYSILKWNKSFLFAYTVNYISNELKKPQ